MSKEYCTGCKIAGEPIEMVGVRSNDPDVEGEFECPVCGCTCTVAKMGSSLQKGFERMFRGEKV